MAQFDAVKEATDSFSKLFERRNWLLGGPSFAGGFIIGVVVVVMLLVLMGPALIRQIVTQTQTPDVPPFNIALFAVVWTVVMFAALAVAAFTNAWALVAAQPVWSGADPAFDRGFNRAAAKVVQLVGFTVLVALMALVSLITLVGPIVIAVLAVYGYAYIVFENKSATQAIGASFRLASENLSETIVLSLTLFLTGVVIAIAGLILSLIPLLGMVAQLGLNWLFYGYTALVTVRFYDLLSLTSGQPPFSLVPKTNA